MSEEELFETRLKAAEKIFEEALHVFKHQNLNTATLVEIQNFIRSKLPDERYSDSCLSFECSPAGAVRPANFYTAMRMLLQDKAPSNRKCHLEFYEDPSGVVYTWQSSKRALYVKFPARLSALSLNVVTNTDP